MDVALFNGRVDRSLTPQGFQLRDSQKGDNRFRGNVWCRGKQGRIDGYVTYTYLGSVLALFVGF